MAAHPFNLYITPPHVCSVRSVKRMVSSLHLWSKTTYCGHTQCTNYTGNYTQYLEITYNGKEAEKEYICSLCCTFETNTIL